MNTTFCDTESPASVTPGLPHRLLANLGRFELPADCSVAEGNALAEFHERTHLAFNQVKDRSVIGKYARERGWSWIAEVLLPKAPPELRHGPSF